MKIKCPHCRKTADVEFEKEAASRRKHATIYYTYTCPNCSVSYTTNSESKLIELLED